MAFHVTRVSLVIAICLAHSGLHPANACAIASTLARDTIEASATIFRGRIVEYEVVRGNIVKLRFAVTETYKGEAQDEWTLLWANSTFAVPEDLEAFRVSYGDDTVVGVTTNSLPPFKVFGPWKDIFGPRTEEISALPMVMQANCAPPVMIEWEGDYFKHLVEWGVVPSLGR
jgi:hypothetical protein